MDKISQHINYSNHIIYSYDQISEIIVNLVCKKNDKNYDYYTKLTHLQKTLLTSIVDTPKKDLSQGEGKSVTREVC